MYVGILYLVLIPHYMTEILLAKECKSGKSTVLALGTVDIKTNIYCFFDAHTGPVTFLFACETCETMSVTRGMV